MIRGAPPGSRPPTARSCWAGVSWPCSGNTSVPGPAGRSARRSRMTSRAPGRKTSASVPGSGLSASAWSLDVPGDVVQELPGHAAGCPAAAGRRAVVIASGVQRRGAVDHGRRARTAPAGPDPPSRTTGREPGASRVADIATSAGRAQLARPRRACRTAGPSPGRVHGPRRGSRRLSRPAPGPPAGAKRMPGVTNSIRVSRAPSGVPADRVARRGRRAGSAVRRRGAARPQRAGDPARLGDDDARRPGQPPGRPRARAGGGWQQRRDQRGLAGTGRGLDHRGSCRTSRTAAHRPAPPASPQRPGRPRWSRGRRPRGRAQDPREEGGRSRFVHLADKHHLSAVPDTATVCGSTWSGRWASTALAVAV